MLNGEIVERGETAAVLERPTTRYTQKLMASVYRVSRPENSTHATSGMSK